MNRKKPAAVEQIEEMIYEILDKCTREQITGKTLTSTYLDDGCIVHETTDTNRSVNTNEVFTIIVTSKFDPSDLKISLAKSFVLDIVKNLKMNNPLWHCHGYHKTRHRHALEELEDMQVLKRLRGSGMCFIFPDKIRRGYILNIIGAGYSGDADPSNASY